jgi:integrase
MRVRISARLLLSPAAKASQKPFEIRDDSLKGFLIRVQPSGVRTYYVQVKRNLRVKVGSVGVLTPDEARERATKILGNHAHGRPLLEGVVGSDRETLGSFIDNFYTPWLRANRPKNADSCLGRIKHNFSSWFDRPLDAICVADIEQWKINRLKEGRKPGTILRDLMTLSGAMGRAVKLRKVVENPFRLIDKPKIDRLPKVRFLNLNEEKRLRAALSERDARLIRERRSANEWRRARKAHLLPDLPHFGDHLTPAVLLSLNSGLRLGELLTLQWTDIDFRSSILTVRGETAKSGHSRHLPLNTEARESLTFWREQSEGNRIFPVTSFKTAWSNLLTTAGIEKFRWHDLRHHFASRLAQEAVPLNVIRELLGHGSLAMVLRYAHLSPDTRRAAVELLDKSNQATFSEKSA